VSYGITSIKKGLIMNNKRPGNNWDDYDEKILPRREISKKEMAKIVMEVALNMTFAIPILMYKIFRKLLRQKQK
jgi:hypothetical protein